uniref:Dynastin-4 n=1 Tax=Limnodynastes salmini TaxID=39404 RepID=DYS4_LIMSA|nr:RecName: Full=Dynastin-4 [Limnodynastes salmini]prf//1923189A dynastin 4 [Limnodynastes salmini]
GLVSNLGI